MENEIEQAKLDIEELIRTAAEKQGIQVINIQWSSDHPNTRWDVEVKASNGLAVYQKFSPEQLTGFQTDNRLKIQVHAKVTSIVVHLNPK